MFTSLLVYIAGGSDDWNKLLGKEIQMFDALRD